MRTGDASHGVIFYEDKRAVWRVSWTLAYAFLLVCGVMRETDAWPWPVFLGVAALLLWIGVSAVWQRAQPLLGVLPGGLRVHAGAIGLGGVADAGEYVIPWEALTSVAYEQRRADRGVAGGDSFVTVLSFGVGQALQRPDGHRGFLEKLVGRRSDWALGEHLSWNAERRKINLLSRPRGGYAKLTANIAEFAPSLGDPSRERRAGLGGSVSYALYDLILGVAVVGTLVLLATDQMDVYTRLAQQLLEWGARVPLAPRQ